MREVKHVTAGQFTAETGLDASFLTDYDKVKERLHKRLVNGANKEYLAGKPHTWVADMAVVYYVFVGDANDGTLTASVTDSLMGNWGVTVEDLDRDCVKEEYSAKGLLQILAEIHDIPYLPIDTEEESFLVCTNDKKLWGAAAVTDTKFMNSLVERFGESVAVIPSSVHEVICFPSSNASYGDFNEMIREVNSTSVADGDRLSDSLYIYNPDSGLRLY